MRYLIIFSMMHGDMVLSHSRGNWTPNSCRCFRTGNVYSAAAEVPGIWFTQNIPKCFRRSIVGMRFFRDYKASGGSTLVLNTSDCLAEVRCMNTKDVSDATHLAGPRFKNCWTCR